MSQMDLLSAKVVEDHLMRKLFQSMRKFVKKYLLTKESNLTQSKKELWTKSN